MIKALKYCCLILLAGVTFTSQGQYLCENEYNTFNKQKKAIKNKTEQLVFTWLAKYQDSLFLPESLKLSKLKFKASEKEIHQNKKYNQWYKVDSLLCVDKDPELVTKAFKLLTELNLVVYNIHTSFNLTNKPDSPIKSELIFEFNISGQLIQTIFRKKKMSPFSETHYH